MAGNERDYDARRAVNELVLSDGEYAYTQDTTKGVINVHTGPTVVNVTGQEHPVVYRSETQRFDRVALEQAAQLSPMAAQGYYCVLWNPAKDSKHPNERSKETGHELLIGQRVNIPGPCTFSLWPRQSAKVIQGHHLRSNQYLLVRVYDEDAARKHWTAAVIKPAAPSGDSKDGNPDAKAEQPQVAATSKKVPEDLSVGRQIIIRGTEVSFYIPPTGVEVVADESGSYVRDALTLERLEYCILIDEDGNKRYERGPAVVFPKPTERFFESDHSRVFRPTELNAIQGIHIKVIADYEENGKKIKAGDELFITGKDTPIYFPRAEHSLVSYDGRAKHFATAIPAGEARYVMNRISGEVKTVRGPTMLLPDPRTEVIVRRVLSDAQCDRWYPGNNEAAEYNRNLRDLADKAPTTRRGVVTEGEASRSRALRGTATAMEHSASHGDQKVVTGGDQFSHGSTYTQPRTITLDTKFAGVPSITVWTGYAVMVVSKKGDRRVEVGPKTILLDYDETLEVLEMSTGKPKTTDNLIRTVYLRVRNNQVSDVVHAETGDHVSIRCGLSLRVNFEGENPAKWFEVENYVKYLCDHVRSVLKGAIRKTTIDEFYSKPEDFIRDTILGQKGENGQRPGMKIAANSLHVYDVEVLKVEIPDERIAKLLSEAMTAAVTSNIQLGRAERDLRVTQRTEEIERAKAEIADETQKRKAALQTGQIKRNVEVALVQIAANIEESNKRLEAQKAQDAVENTKSEAQIARSKALAAADREVEAAKQALRLEALKNETDAIVRRFEAGSKGLSEALITLGNQETVTRLAQALSVQTMLGGGNFAEVVSKVLGETPLADIVKQVGTKALPQIPSNGAGHGGQPRA